VTFTFDLLTLEVESESHVTCTTSVPNLTFLGLSVIELFPMYATDRRQTKASLNASALTGRGHNKRAMVRAPMSREKNCTLQTKHKRRLVDA